MSIFITSKAIDFIQLRTSATKLILIITEDEWKIQSLIQNKIDRGLTKIRSVGGYSEREKTIDRKSTRLNSSHVAISYAVFCLKKKKKKNKKNQVIDQKKKKKKNIDNVNNKLQ